MIGEQEFFAEIEANGFNLTHQQKQAVVHDQGPLLLLAVPGAGKTTVLTIRLVYLIFVKNVDPRRILCLTFGRAAAKEMRERFINNFGGSVPYDVKFSTIHSFAFEVIRSSFGQRGIRFEILEERSGARSKTAILRRIYEKRNLSTPTEEQLEELQNSICYVKNTLSQSEAFSTDIQNFSGIFNDYEKYKESHQPRLIDYDDMLSIAYTEFKDKPQCVEDYRKHIDYILTDESQDTSLLQHKIIELIAKPKQNLFVVGDDDQSIFGFRAADPKYLLDFEQTYPGAKILRMEQNFRSTSQIVEVSRQFIRTNTLRYDKAMFTKNPKGTALGIDHFKGIREQNQFIIQTLKRQENLSAVGILYRNNLSALCLVEELSRAKILFYMRDTGKQRFFTHWAIQDVLNFLRFSFSDKSFTVFERIWTKLPCSVRKHHVEQLKEKSIERSIFDLLAEHSDCSSKLKREYDELKRQFKELNKLPPAQAIRFIRSDLEYDKTVNRICDSLGFSADYITGLLDILYSLAQNERSIVGFANRLTFLEEQITTSYKNKQSNAVTLSTIHSAKGLEWEQVYLIDLVDGIIPEREAIKASRSSQKELLEEERRLFYVGITRAKKLLTLCSMDYYHRKKVKTSRLVREVTRIIEGKNPQDSISEEVASLGDFAPGLVVEHKTFGEGVILREEENMITVRFKDGSQRSFLKEICEKQHLIWAV